MPSKPQTAITPKVDPLALEAQKYKSAEEFVKAIQANPEKIPTTPEYQKYLKENDAFVKQENSLYAQMKAMRDTYAGKTIKDVPASDITKYENLQKELSQTLSKKTMAKSPEGVIKTHIGDKALQSQLTDFYNQATKPVETPTAELNGAKNALANNQTGIKQGGVERAKAEIQAGNTPPVKIRTLEDGSKFIEDGRHHLQAATELGLKTYPTEDVTSKYPESSCYTSCYFTFFVNFKSWVIFSDCQKVIVYINY